MRIRHRVMLGVLSLLAGLSMVFFILLGLRRVWLVEILQNFFREEGNNALRFLFLGIIIFLFWLCLFTLAYTFLGGRVRKSKHRFEFGQSRSSRY